MGRKMFDMVAFSSEILKVVSAMSTLVLFFCPCCANFWSLDVHCALVLREALIREKKDLL